MTDMQARRCRCGTRLARDNTSDRCAACTTTARSTNGNPAEPPVVPLEFWTHPGMRAALDAWHMGRVIAAYRTHPHHGRPLRQETVAAWVGITQPQLSRIEHGPPIIDLGRLTQWARLLCIPPERLWFQVQKQRAARPPAHTPVPVPVLARAIISGPGGSGGDAAAVAAWRTVDAQIGGAHLYATVIAYLRDLVAPRLFGGKGGEGAGVFTAAAALTEMAGWMAHDAGHNDRAGRHFARARDLSGVGDDPHLRVHVLASLAHLAHHRAQPDDAIDYATQGQQELTAGASHPELAARLWALQARGHAAAGRSRETRAKLDRAETALQDSNGAAPSPWVSPFDAGSLAGEAARCMRQLGDLPAAQHHAQRVLELRPAGRTRSRAFAHLTLAGVLIERGELEQACTVATDVLHTTGSLGSYLVIQQLRDLRDQLHPHRATNCARNFLDHLAESLRQREWLYQLTTDITQPRTSPTP
ncbi:helix-turn-helix domain-containing protein [Streptosporangium subroseum]|uniref:helix-turn-helix domain-containing protein n=1 Tax=Streptosporangium subroseum TaxID=106412 RepID=UPI003084F97E|nr:helix-turn-helix domain-containing protein [Streptosporangium subroseum]